ncbi:MAG: hypothetical protein EON56_00010 [Alphaproteobacteria bacterium]|nr:MAG: hypothetical protein EON56_00010 [Alphaproteobacteria bacterium]
MTQQFQPSTEACTIAADLLARLAINPTTGQPFVYDSVEAVEAAVEAEVEPEVVRLGPVRLRVIDAEPTEIALATGAIEEDMQPTICLLVEFERGTDQPEAGTGQYVALPTEEGVTLLFRVWLAHADLHDLAGPEFGLDADRNEALDAIAAHPGRALLVQVLDFAEEAAP